MIPEELDLDDILPEDFQSFYRYSGSLTTPRCDEVVTWTVFSNPNFMSSAQLQQFRTLTNDENRPLVNNDRPVQPMGNRIVQFVQSGRRPSSNNPTPTANKDVIYGVSKPVKATNGNTRPSNNLNNNVIYGTNKLTVKGSTVTQQKPHQQLTPVIGGYNQQPVKAHQPTVTNNNKVEAPTLVELPLPLAFRHQQQQMPQPFWPRDEYPDKDFLNKLNQLRPSW
jgi:hypothetical protein